MTKIPEPAFAGADWSRDVPSLVRIVQGVTVARVLDSGVRGLAVARAQRSEASSICGSNVCRHFTVLFAALLRETGIPAKARRVTVRRSRYHHQ